MRQRIFSWKLSGSFMLSFLRNFPVLLCFERNVSRKHFHAFSLMRQRIFSRILSGSFMFLKESFSETFWNFHALKRIFLGNFPMFFTSEKNILYMEQGFSWIAKNIFKNFKHYSPIVYLFHFNLLPHK